MNRYVPNVPDKGDRLSLLSWLAAQEGRREWTAVLRFYGRCHWLSMRLRHGMVWHQWRKVGPIIPDGTTPHEVTYDKCDWCGRVRGSKVKGERLHYLVRGEGPELIP